MFNDGLMVKVADDDDDDDDDEDDDDDDGDDDDADDVHVWPGWGGTRPANGAFRKAWHHDISAPGWSMAPSIKGGIPVATLGSSIL